MVGIGEKEGRRRKERKEIAEGEYKEKTKKRIFRKNNDHKLLI